MQEFIPLAESIIIAVQISFPSGEKTALWFIASIIIGLSTLPVAQSIMMTAPFIPIPPEL
jgi:hypothetical protein